jgi:hypothetical protein
MFRLTRDAKYTVIKHQQYIEKLLPVIACIPYDTYQGGQWELHGFVAKIGPQFDESGKLTFIRYFCRVSDVNFALDGPMTYLNALNRLTLDYLNGKFMFRS